MKRTHTRLFYVTSAAVFVVMTCGPVYQCTAETAISDFIPGSCTIFTATRGEKVLFGNNEDFTTPTTYYWVEPRSEGNFGGVYFGFSDFVPQGGINEKGLAYDIDALPAARLNPHPELPPPPAELPAKIQWAVKTIMKKAATVEESIDIARRYKRENWGIPLKYQVILADAKGDAVVIGAGPDGELVFTRKKPGDGYLVSTNFNRANPKNAYSYPCERYDKAVEMLAKIQDEDDLTVDYFKSILDATHVEDGQFEGAPVNTLYSNIYDLRNGIIHLYYWHQFDEVVKLDVAERIGKGAFKSRISDLFSKETVDRALAKNRGLQVLDRFVGTWDLHVTLKPPQGAATIEKTSEIRKWSLGGKFVHFQNLQKENPNAPELHMLLTYDARTKSYPGIMMIGPNRSLVNGTWDKQAKTMDFAFSDIRELPPRLGAWSYDLGT